MARPRGSLTNELDLRPHGTMAAARRHYRREGPGWECRACRQAEARRWQDRAAGVDQRRRDRRYAEWRARIPELSAAEFDAWWEARRWKAGAVTKAAA